MNYRHTFHAGNHGDVLKHATLLTLLDYLQRKKKPIFVLDTHAGRGYYDLSGEEARRTQESVQGIGRLAAADVRSIALKRYLDAIDRFRAATNSACYPGSPRLIADALRAGDRLVCCEWQTDEARLLKRSLVDTPGVSIHHRDGYEAIRALLPPSERRGLVLIDPPYETRLEEFPRIESALLQGLQRWPGGVFAIWYPIKDRRAIQPFLRHAAGIPVNEMLTIELLLQENASPLAMNGSGMLIVNPPWQIERELEPMIAELAKKLGQEDSRGYLRWLRREKAE